MSELLKQLAEWMSSGENERLEFKEAKNQYDFEKLVRYCAALANEGGGRIIFGVTDQEPRQVVGTKAYPNLEKAKVSLMERLPQGSRPKKSPIPRGECWSFRFPRAPRLSHRP